MQRPATLPCDDAHPARHQVTELPRVVPAVTEYRQHPLTLAVCGACAQALGPETKPRGCFGPRVQGTVAAYLTGHQGISQRNASEMLEALCHLKVSLGSIAALEQPVSAAVAAPVDEAHTYVQTQHT